MELLHLLLPCVSGGGGGEADGGGERRLQVSGGDAPSTPLRAVPLPRFAGEEERQ